MTVRVVVDVDVLVAFCGGDPAYVVRMIQDIVNDSLGGSPDVNAVCTLDES
jgi:hypothetical protein